jgi:hypothetical protein
LLRTNSQAGVTLSTAALAPCPVVKDPEETIFTPDETVFAWPRKPPETVAGAACAMVKR